MHNTPRNGQTMASATSPALQKGHPPPVSTQVINSRNTHEINVPLCIWAPTFYAHSNPLRQLCDCIYTPCTFLDCSVYGSWYSLGCGSVVLAAMTMLAPSCAALRAMALPIPRLVPVTQDSRLTESWCAYPDAAMNLASSNSLSFSERSGSKFIEEWRNSLGTN